LLQVKGLRKHFSLPGAWFSGHKRYIYAVDGVDLDVDAGEVFGLVGESGCGKTTLGRMLLRLIEPTSGQVFLDGQEVTQLKAGELRLIRRKMQIVFQNPLSSLSPRYKVLDTLAEPLRTHRLASGGDVRKQAVTLLELVGMGAQHLDRFPHELSGGQCQRVAVARALSVDPHLIVLDEPTSALDVSVQAQILNLLDELRRTRRLTYIFISHDLNVVQHISDRIGVMYLGKLVEVGPTEAIFAEPLHPYTQALLGAIPLPVVDVQRELAILEGAVPSPANPPPGCRFHTRCPLAQAVCVEREPSLRVVRKNRLVACHLVEPGAEITG
jgi:oligopeptide/dipeptide ABC transporter ATP-binding protein